MPSSTINDLIQMYSTGVISRESLEREIRVWDLEDENGDLGCKRACIDDDLVLYPDQTGTWRVPS